jgi:formyltetrahydrofolate deformylase
VWSGFSRDPLSPRTGDSKMSSTASGSSYIYAAACPDQPGIVAAVSGFLAERRLNILDADQFNDHLNGRFFIRVHFTELGDAFGVQKLREELVPLASRFDMHWSLHDTLERPRLLVLVSKLDHCLHDLLYRHRNGELRADIPMVVSNHKDCYGLAAWYDIPYRHMPVTPETKPQQERKLAEIVEEERIDFIVLARYMQVLSDAFCTAYPQRVINIHHSFLPSFKGAKPYHQAYERGVKLIGATAHFVTSDLDEGPIIDQDVVRVDHTLSPDELVAAGRDVERRVLSRAVEHVVERRVLLNGEHRTVVFRRGGG